MVRVEGFEPSTSPPRTGRTTRLCDTRFLRTLFTTKNNTSNKKSFNMRKINQVFQPRKSASRKNRAIREIVPYSGALPEDGEGSGRRRNRGGTPGSRRSWALPFLNSVYGELVETTGVEPVTSRLPALRSPY